MPVAQAESSTNRRTLTVTKSPSPANGEGIGTVMSKPMGVGCGPACSEAVASMYKDQSILLKAKASTGSTLVGWTGCDSSTNTGTEGTCTVKMTEAREVKTAFGGTSKAIANPQPLTVSKGEGSGRGAVKAYGSLACEAECTETTVLYQGPITEPKVKAGKTVTLKQYPAFGSKFLGWTGCDTVTEVGECLVEMDEAHTVEVEYEALPNKVLTIDKAYSSGYGSVASKPRGIRCATTCTQAVASMPEGASVELLAKPGLETAFVEWVGGDCNGSTSVICIVTMNTDETTKAVFSKGGKAFLGGSEPTLTLNKAGSGYGTVKAYGSLTCEVLCTSTSALFQGPITEPKVRPGKTAILKAASAPGSTAVAWTGCDTVTEAGECVVKMEESYVVTATFDELE
jgi:hypothetical protein